MWIIISILLFIIIILCSLFLVQNNYDYYKNVSPTKVSLIILSHKRPHNLEKSIPILSTYDDVIQEILIFHGQKDYYRDFRSSGKVPVKNFFDTINDEIYGGARRVFHYSKCRSDLIFFLDDDLLPSKEYIKRAINYFAHNPQSLTMVGSKVLNVTYGIRHCDKKGYKKGIDDKDQLPRISASVVPKQIVGLYMKIAFPQYESWLKEYKGNCEDLGLILFIKNYYKTDFVLVDGDVHELDKTDGYHHKDNHYQVRDAFCQQFHLIRFDDPPHTPNIRPRFIDSFHHFYNQQQMRFESLKPVFMDGIIDQIYCICLDKRKEKMTEHFHDIGIFKYVLFMKPVIPADLSRDDYERFSETMNDPDSVLFYKLSKLPVHLSYLLVMRHAMQHRFKKILILEDDVQFEISLDTIKNYLKAFASMIFKDSAILYLGYCGLSCTSKYIEKTNEAKFYRLNDQQNIYCKHAIVHCTSYFNHFFETHPILSLTSDHTFNQYYKSNHIQRCITNYALITQDRNTFRSQNENFNALSTCTFKSPV